MRILIQLIKCNLKEIYRDTIQMVCFIILPIIYTLLFGYVFSKSDMAANSNMQVGIFPGILAITIMQLGMLGANRIILLKEKKVLRTLSATILSKRAFFTADIIVKLIVGFIQSFIVLLIGYFIFDFRIKGNIIVILIWILLGIIAFITMGYGIVAICKTVNAANGIIQILQIMMMFLSGVFLPTELLPKIIKPVVNALPLKYLVEGLKYAVEGIMPKGSLTFDMIVLVVTIFIGSLLSLKSSWD